MDRLFLDANVLFSAAYRANAGLLAFWKLADATLCSSKYAVEEARINLAEDVQKRRLTKIAGSIALFEAVSYFGKTIEGVLVATPTQYLQGRT
jgi:hypothetical protein